MTNNYLKLYSQEDLLKRPGEGDTTEVEARVMMRHSVVGMSLMEATVPPNGLLPPHTHQHSHQGMYLIKGDMWINLGGLGPDGMTFLAPEGSYILKPKRVVHSFWNLNDTTNTYIELTDNDLFEGFIESRRKGALFGGETEMRADWGQFVDTELMVEVLRKYKLTRIAQAGYELDTRAGIQRLLSELPPGMLDMVKEGFGADKVEQIMNG
ncbi:MAG: cupin domain-containing protein [Planctomycetota bacterium]